MFASVAFMFHCQREKQLKKQKSHTGKQSVQEQNTEPACAFDLEV